MVLNSSSFQSEIGDIALSVNPVDGSIDEDTGTASGLGSVDFSSAEGKDWGLATKFYTLSALYQHNNDKDAHAGIFGSILSTFKDIVTSSGTFCFNTIRDNDGNYINASGKVMFDGVSGYIVTSKNRRASFDTLSAELDATKATLLTEIGKKQNKLVAGDGIALTYDEATGSTIISVAETPSLAASFNSTSTESTAGINHIAISSENSNITLLDSVSNVLDISTPSSTISVEFQTVDNGRLRAFTILVNGCDGRFEIKLPDYTYYTEGGSNPMASAENCKDGDKFLYSIKEISSNVFTISRKQLFEISNG